MNYYNQFKDELIKSKIKIAAKDYSKNKIILERNYNIGKILIEAQGGEKRAKYGNKLIEEYSNKFYEEMNERYSTTSLKYMRQFYLFISIGHAMRDQLSTSHYRELFSLNDFNEIEYYIDLTINNNLTYRQLHDRIKNKEYERLDDKTKEKLKQKEPLELIDTVKEPIVIKVNEKIEKITEYALKQKILEDLDYFLKELGEGYTYVGNEYKIKIGNNYNYIDLLFFNYIYNAFVVIELKITELKKEHIGQILTYVGYIDDNIKSIYHNKTIGIILVRKNNKMIMKYCTDERIFSKEYVFSI